MEAADDRPVSERFTAETFLVSDTGKRDRRGRGIVHVLGGVIHGWQVRALRP
ncbi:hypothetical protein [Ornithinimicrobium cavernae]|uniref:hypothetical protein n=1 Tax=Ornithinimicrobium cavernae TaxID=2666047 RepID=UPI0012B1831F|nr:hypothetical protein [Ornithinimicrobium cavernae]